MFRGKPKSAPKKARGKPGNLVSAGVAIGLGGATFAGAWFSLASLDTHYRSSPHKVALASELPMALAQIIEVNSQPLPDPVDLDAAAALKRYEFARRALLEPPQEPLAGKLPGGALIDASRSEVERLRALIAAIERDEHPARIGVQGLKRSLASAEAELARRVTASIHAARQRYDSLAAGGAEPEGDVPARLKFR